MLPTPNVITAMCGVRNLGCIAPNLFGSNLYRESAKRVREDPMIPAFAPIMLMALPNSAIHPVMSAPVPGRLLATPERGSFFHVLDRIVGGTTLTATREIARYSAITITRVNMVARGMVFHAMFV